MKGEGEKMERRERRLESREECRGE